MRPLVSVFVLVLALSANAAEQQTTLDQVAEDYVHLALEIGAHEKDFVDAYFGPPEWRVEAEAHPRNISELKATSIVRANTTRRIGQPTSVSGPN